MESATVHILNSNESTLGAGTRSADEVLTPAALPLSLDSRKALRVVYGPSACECDVTVPLRPSWAAAPGVGALHI